MVVVVEGDVVVVVDVAVKKINTILVATEVGASVEDSRFSAAFKLQLLIKRKILLVNFKHSTHLLEPGATVTWFDWACTPPLSCTA